MEWRGPASRTRVRGEDLQRAARDVQGGGAEPSSSKEVAPHIEEWEAAGRIPRLDLAAHGRARAARRGVRREVRRRRRRRADLGGAARGDARARARGSFAMAVGVHTDMASPHLYWTGSEALKEKYLPAICRGEALTAIAVTEPGGGSDVAAIRTRAVRDGDHYVSTAPRCSSPTARLADVYFVAARIETAEPASATAASRCSSSSARRRASR